MHYARASVSFVLFGMIWGVYIGQVPRQEINIIASCCSVAITAFFDLNIAMFLASLLSFYIFLESVWAQASPYTVSEYAGVLVYVITLQLSILAAFKHSLMLPRESVVKYV